MIQRKVFELVSSFDPEQRITVTVQALREQLAGYGWSLGEVAAGAVVGGVAAEPFVAVLPRAKAARIAAGEPRGGDVAALRAFVGLSQTDFAEALGISRRTLQGWEHGRTPDGSGLALLRLAARHPSIIRGSISAAR